MLTRRQSLPPLASLSTHIPPHLLGSNIESSESAIEGAETEKLLNKECESSDKHEPALTPGGSFSPQVHELLESFKSRIPKRTCSNGSVRQHRRTGSNESFRIHRRQGSNGSYKHTTLEQSQRGEAGTNKPQANSSLERTPVAYTKLDTTESESENPSSTVEPLTSTSTADPESSLPQSVIDHSGRFPTRPSPKLRGDGRLKVVYSAQSSRDAISDGHDADPESNDESEREDECLSESNDDTPPSHSTDELTSCSTPDLVQQDKSTTAENTIKVSIPELEQPTSGMTSQLFDSSVTARDRSCEPPSNTYDNTSTLGLTPVGVATMDEHSVTRQKTPGQVAMLISQFEHNVDDATPPSIQAGTSPKLEVPIHIRRDVDTSGTYSPVQVEEALSMPAENALGNSTTIVRYFFENMGSKRPFPDLLHMRRASSTELEDSGFQVLLCT